MTNSVSSCFFRLFCSHIVCARSEDSIMSDFGDTFDNFDDNTVVAHEQEIKLFGKWSTNDVIVSDISLGVSC